MSLLDVPAQGQAELAATPGFSAYPELQPIRMLAVDAAVYTFAIDLETEHELVIHLEEMVADALIAAYAPIGAIARRATRVANGARDAQLAATAQTAQMMAAVVAEVAAAVRARGDDSAVKVAQAASDAADLVAASVEPGGEGAAASAAALVATAVRDAAAAKAEEHAQAAAVVAQAAASAAARMADTASVQDIAVELKVFEAAAAVQVIALDACYQVAINAAATAAANAYRKKMPIRQDDEPAADDEFGDDFFSSRATRARSSLVPEPRKTVDLEQEISAYPCREPARAALAQQYWHSGTAAPAI